MNPYKTIFAGTASALAIMGGAAVLAQSPVVDVFIRSARTVVAFAPGLGVDKVCVVPCAEPTNLVACVDTDPATDGQEVTFDVTPLMTVGTPACFRAVSVSPEGIQSTESENAARGTVPATPVLR